MNVWMDDEAGPVVRPYALTRGRTRPSGETFDLIALVSAVREGGSGPEQEAILRAAQSPISVADLAVELDLPVGVVQVILGDMRDHGLISVTSQVGSRPSERILKEVINGLRAL
ncbi:DUF742 domain-containing protein [Nonomuraea soli]|uniref:Putative Rossmann fold nucleotide-binding protein DprA/Smf involved in DNA uptake n=1 Tax=Nonomuraea soli TaxID=1032476 RepID=A0A7W0CIH9_9ACTN|nr:DUF742 domain-containing protein [Nonomuraea soli]MBA2891587.1 putative Rossmann fold nucleotide-binding protein DprA/Smf involved in DNA uptake [Nonomuraea soli]